MKGHVGNDGSHHQQSQYDDWSSSAKRRLVSEFMDEFEVPSSKRHQVECWLSRYELWNLDKETGSRSLRLIFLNKIGKIVFTGVPIIGENGQFLMVALVDESGEIVTDGPEASAEVKIFSLALEDKNKGKERLLTGDMVLQLKEGQGYVGSLKFPHTSIYMRKCEYMFGARANNAYYQTTIREGYTNSFRVKDRREDLYKKHYPPNLSDEVWRLVGIERNGAIHKRLSNNEVNTVWEFLIKHKTEPQTLRDIVMGPDKKWDAIVAHAWTFSVDPPSEGFQETQCSSFEMRSESGKAYAMNLVVSASQQWDEVVSYDKLLGPIENVSCDLPQPATSFKESQQWDEVVSYDKLFDESPSPSNIIYPPNPLITEGSSMIISTENMESPFDKSSTQDTIIESSCTTVASISQENNELVYSPLAFSFDESPGPSSSETLIFPEIDEHHFRQSVVSYQEIVSSCADIESTVYGELNDIHFPQTFSPPQEFILAHDSVWGMSY